MIRLHAHGVAAPTSLVNRRLDPALTSERELPVHTAMQDEVVQHPDLDERECLP